MSLNPISLVPSQPRIMCGPWGRSRTFRVLTSTRWSMINKGCWAELQDWKHAGYSMYDFCCCWSLTSAFAHNPQLGVQRKWSYNTANENSLKLLFKKHRTKIQFQNTFKCILQESLASLQIQFGVPYVHIALYIPAFVHNLNWIENAF